MARKRTPDGRRVTLCLKLSEAEAAAVDAARGTLTRSEYGRRAVLVGITSATWNRHHPAGKRCHHWSHGLNCDQYDQLRARAAGHCEICGVAEEDAPRGGLVIDHFAAGDDSFVRGLLCRPCNSGVMSCHDGNKVWGTNRKWEAKAREYEANSFQQPSATALEKMAARTEALPGSFRPVIAAPDPEPPARPQAARCPHPGTRSIGGYCKQCDVVVEAGGYLPAGYVPPSER